MNKANNNNQMLIDEFGFPLYVYREEMIEQQVNVLKNALPDFDVFYSFKANPNPFICKFLATKGLGADTASSNEVMKAVMAGYDKEDIIYSSPGKVPDDIHKSIDHSTIIADSYHELKMINELCAKKNRIAKIGLRINPNYSLTEGAALEVMGGTPSKFGVDEETLKNHKSFIDSLKYVQIIGIHVYMGSQILDYKQIYNNLKSIFEIGSFCIKEMQWDIQFIDFGGGFGVPYQPDEKPLDLQALKSMVQSLVNDQKIVRKEKVRLIVESGRFLVTQGGQFLTKVVDIKESRGEKYLIVHGGMNGFFRPIFMDLLHPISIPSRSKEQKEQVTVGGNMCTPIDVLAKDIFLPKANIGDILCISNAGSYGYTMSLKEFISQPKPKELYIDKASEILITGVNEV